ncbi:hypothetical protein BR93DRAFT_967329 [Coniochaeta sp. PMI_546]|nr:hypothetical protein BR93DRAFT_967329 [Coniochaeta sp. PMI_546]
MTTLGASATSSYGWTDTSSNVFTIETINPSSEPTTFMTLTSPAPGPSTSNVIDSGQGPLDHHHPHGTAVAPPNPDNTIAAREAAGSDSVWAFWKLKHWEFLRGRPEVEGHGR